MFERSPTKESDIILYTKSETKFEIRLELSESSIRERIQIVWKVE